MLDLSPNYSQESRVAASAIAAMAASLAEKRNGGSAAASAIIECMVAAATPMVADLFIGGTLQERLLFTLIFAGSCATMRNETNGAFSVAVEVSPENLTDAFLVFEKVTGKDIRRHLPKTMVRFAETAALQ